MDPLQNYKILDEAEAYELWEERGVPDDVYPTCDEHFLYKLDDKGNVVLTAAGRHAAARTTARAKKTPSERRYELRLDLIQKLGGECGEETCEETRPPYLQILWGPGVRPDRLTGVEWLRFLQQDGNWVNCVLRCVRHPYSRPAVVRKSDKEEAVAAYGGQCVRCGETDLETLRVEPDTGTHAPRYPGGRKMGSRDKYRWLRLHGFPRGWAVRCAPCAAGGRVRSS